MVTFLALTAALAIVVKRPPLERLVLVLSALPVAVAANVLRISVTAVLHETVGSGVAYAVYHDWAGWFMMPAALGMLGLELALLKRLTIRGPEPLVPLPLTGLRPALEHRPLNQVAVPDGAEVSA